jgi:hypothetical protein
MSTAKIVVMPRDYLAQDPSAPKLVLAHGAGAGHDHAWMIRVAKGLAARGVHVVTFDFPYIERGKSVPDPGPVLEAAFVDIWKGAGARFAGGKSMGGRDGVAGRAGWQASVPPAAGPVFFGYPLHPLASWTSVATASRAIDAPMRARAIRSARPTMTPLVRPRRTREARTDRRRRCSLVALKAGPRASPRSCDGRQRSGC